MLQVYASAMMTATRMDGFDDGVGRKASKSRGRQWFRPRNLLSLALLTLIV